MDIQAFFSSIATGDLEAVRQQLEDAPFLLHVHHPDKEAWQELSPLHCAAKHGQLEIARFLIERGAEVYSNPLATYPAVIIAAWNKQQDLVNYFLQEIPNKAQGTNGLGVTLNLAAREGWADLVRQHIAADPLSVHQRGWIGDTPLHWPAHNGSVEIVELLLDAGADIEADEINCYGGKPLHWASEHQPKTVELLLKRGANVNARNIKKDSDFLGFTPLIMNAFQRNDCAEVTELLLQAGADIQAQDAKGKTALTYAIEGEHARVLEVLHSHGSAE
ncbi:MAG: ankyrin repeat domain-containing protein [bacterium]|nr:ankyrin repeat domain-containing protein [bacterium]